MNSNHLYDYVVIGAGLSGLTVATRVSQETQSVLLLESSDQVGGMNKASHFSPQTKDNGLRLIPAADSDRRALEDLENLLGLKLIKNIHQESLVTFESGALKTFTGFGENAPDFYDALAPFLSEKTLECHLGGADWISLLQQKYLGQIQTRSTVTRIHWDKETSEFKLTVNGSKTVKAKNVVYSGYIKELPLLLSEEYMSHRTKSRLGKSTYWTGVCLDLQHASKITESTQVHLLNGTTNDEIGPCLGRFMAAPESSAQQTSQWMTFVDEEVTEDSEVLAMALKKIKKQIKRAYPEALEAPLRERIFIAPMIVGHGDLKLTAGQTVPELEQLWVASSALASGSGVTTALKQAFLVLAAMGFSQSSYLSFAQTPEAVVTP